ncbi:zinc finger CW-type PWWP domain protein 1 isoform X2 [Gracilinanus agilis]|uniref:zinc finger CW-type PWWP domain protein 1 isoform X2 n=1 Tax=Gracilinanus agilis TaxID=191870 RepID=UPI001CFE768F|nr:zinc finger CW-type PWWP domain protein 1 isoform X2 [Gracilinanus agilis]
MMTTLKNKEDGKEQKKIFAWPRPKVSTVTPYVAPDSPNNEDTQEIRVTGVNAKQSQPKDKTEKKKKEKVTKKSSGSDKEGKVVLAPKTSKEQDTKGTERKTEKKPSLTNEQFEEIVQCVLQKSLQECLDLTCETSGAQHIECSRGAKETGIIIATSDVDRKLLEIPYPPITSAAKEDGIVPGTQSSKPDLLPSEKKQNTLPLSNKKKEENEEKTELTQKSRKHRRKGQPRKIVQGYTQISDQEESGGEWAGNFGHCIAWVQCSFPSCEKWRRLHGNVDPSILPDDWSCSQNTDLQFNHCDAPEEFWSGCENDVVYASYIPGSIIWAKQYGYPWWPGMVELDPDLGEYFLFTSQQDVLPAKYHVTFFGNSVSRAWISSNMLKNFQELSLEQVEPKKIKNKDCSQKLMAALVMAREAQLLSIKERVSLFGFSSRYKENASESDSSEEEGDIFFKETKKIQSAGSSNFGVSKEENKYQFFPRQKELCLTSCNPINTSKEKLRLKGTTAVYEQGGTLKRKRNKRSPSQGSSTVVEKKGSSGNSQSDQPGPKKKFAAPQRKTMVTKLPGKGGDRVPKNQSPSPDPLVETGKKIQPKGPLVLMARSQFFKNKVSSDLNLEELMEEVGERISQKEEQQEPLEEEEEISIVLSEE